MVASVDLDPLGRGRILGVFIWLESVGLSIALFCAITLGVFVYDQSAPPGELGLASEEADSADLPNATFTRLNDGWNAEPNAPGPNVVEDGDDVVLRFFLNAFQFPEFKEGDLGILRFSDCSRYRLGPTNDEGWYRGQCRFSKRAPAWGEFYLATGDSNLLDAPEDWRYLAPPRGEVKHFLFYFRDNTFECVAETCEFESAAENAIRRIGKKLP